MLWKLYLYDRILEEEKNGFWTIPNLLALASWLCVYSFSCHFSRPYPIIIFKIYTKTPTNHAKKTLNFPRTSIQAEKRAKNNRIFWLSWNPFKSISFWKTSIPNQLFYCAHFFSVVFGFFELIENGNVIFFWFEENRIWEKKKKILFIYCYFSELIFFLTSLSNAHQKIS